MKKITISFADSLKFVPEHPDRTAKKSLEWDVTFQVWPNRQSLIKTIEMQRNRAPKRGDWIPVVPIKNDER